MPSRFQDNEVNLDVLRNRAFNGRWAEVEQDVIPLTAADMDFPAADVIGERLCGYIRDGYFSYTPKLGLPQFRQSLSNHLVTAKGEQVPPKWILPIDSAARGMYVIAQAVLQPGDEVLIFDPVDYLFKQAALSAGAVPVLYPARVHNGAIDLDGLEAYITPKTKMIGLCNPHNPLGMLYSREQLDHILTLAQRYDLWIMNDEIWSDITYPEKAFCSILSLGQARNRKTLSVFGFSKSYGVAGLRIGCVYAQEEQAFQRVVDASAVMTTAGGISSLSQVAGIACLDDCGDWLRAYQAHLLGNRDYAWARINAMPMLSCRRPEATFLLFIDIRQTGLDSAGFTDYVLERGRLALVPGTEQFFGPGAEGFVRLSFATSRGLLKAGLDRLEQVVSTLQKEGS